jgi:hypothetical protein
MTDIASLDFSVSSRRYHDGFEKAFAINPITGDIVCIDEEVELFYNSYIVLIQIFTGFQPPAIISLKENPDSRLTQLTRAYAYALIAYKKISNLYCDKAQEYTPDLFIEA